MRMGLRRSMLAALGAFLLPACAGSIYGEYRVSDDSVVYAEGNAFTAVNASEYTRWVYVDLAEGKAALVDEYLEGNTVEPPAVWHFAMHRFDCKTDGAEVLETSFTDIDALAASGSVPQGTFVADRPTADRIAYDMSGMMDGDILYAESDYNPELSKWMEIDTGGMPPTYTPSGRVYLLRFGDGTMAAVRFTGYIGPKSVKGYNSFEYLYPIEF